MSETPSSPHPKHIGDILPDAVFSEPDTTRRHESRQRDLEYEVNGLTADISDLNTHMKETADPALPERLEQTTDAALGAQRDLREHKSDDIT